MAETAQQIGDSRAALNYAQIDLAKLVRLCCHAFDTLAEQRAVHYHVHTPETLLVPLDAARVEGIILNLLFNAFKFAPEGGVISCVLEAGPSAERVRLRVSDSGNGLPTSMWESIFDPDRQLDRNIKLETGGTGLGLGASRQVARDHGGDLCVQSGPQRGPQFELTLPLDPPAGLNPAAAPVEPSARATRIAEMAAAELRIEGMVDHGPQLLGNRPLVLVVDDSRAMNRLLTEYLRRDFDTLSAFDGNEGLQLARQVVPHLVVTDVIMPNMSGPQMVAAMRKEANLADIPILVLSGSDNDKLRVQLLEQGVQDYLTKPFLIEELRARVRNLLNAKQARDLLNSEVEHNKGDLVELATEVTRHQRELRTALEQMRVAREVAERANSAKSDFLRMMSHELRTPITALQLHIRMLEREADVGLTDRQQTALVRIRRSYGRLLQLIDGIVAYARLESGRLSLHAQPFDLGLLVEGIISELNPQAEQKGVSISWLRPPGLPQLVNDQGLVRLVALNTLGHLIDCSQSGPLDVRVQHQDRLYEVSVRNPTLHLSSLERDQLFEPLGQPRNLRREPGFGSGLGLAIVKELVGALGGNIAADSGAQGTAFVIALPSTPVDESAPAH